MIKRKNGNHFFALQSKLFLAIIINAVSIHGEYGEAVNTSGCEPDIGRCDSCYSPHNRIHTLIQSGICEKPQKCSEMGFFLIY